MTITAINIGNIRKELTNSLRSGDIITTAIRGVTTASDTFTATAGQNNFTFTHTYCHNIRSVSVQAVDKFYMADYTFNGTTLILNTGANLADSVIVSYDYGATAGDKIYPDFPRDDLSLTSFPRIGMGITSIRTEPLGLGGKAFINDILLTVDCVVPTNKDSSVSSGFGGTDDLSTLLEAVKSRIINQAKSFYSFKWIQPSGASPIIPSTNGKIIKQGIDFIIKFVVEN